MSSLALAAVGWPDVMVALIAGLPAIIAAVAAILIRREVHTTSGTTLAQTVEHAHETAVENQEILKKLNGELTGDK